jgi:isopenicillin-N N-acyltransferase-like protein
MHSANLSRRTCLAVIGAGAVAAAATSKNEAKPARNEGKDAFPLIEVSGGSYQMGYQHGRQASDLIQSYLRWIEKMTGRPRSALCANAMRFLPYIEALSHKYVEEVSGLAAGAGISFEEAMLCQARGEAARRWEGGCTAFALTGKATADGNPLAGQNQDLPRDFSDVAVVLRVRPNDGRPAAVIFTFAGQLGYSGMNQFGVAHFANALYNSKWQPGLLHYPLKRVMLEQRTVSDVVELARRYRTCSAANLVLCDGQGHVGDVEIRPEGIAVFDDDQPDRRLHTNHYLTRQFAPYENGSLPDSVPRLARIRALVQQNWGRITVETMKQLLSDHEGYPAAICRHESRGMESISGYIAEPAKGLLHVRRGRGCDGSWHAYPVVT